MLRLIEKNQVRRSAAEWAESEGLGGTSVGRRGLLVQEGLSAGGPVHELLGLEPQVDLQLGVLQGVAAVDDVPEETSPEADRLRIDLRINTLFIYYHFIINWLLITDWFMIL